MNNIDDIFYEEDLIVVTYGYNNVLKTIFIYL